MDDKEAIKQQVEVCINKLISRYKKNPEIFLTEEDIRCYLYKLLLRFFNTPKNTSDKSLAKKDEKLKNIRSIAIHCEVRWYGKNNKLKYRSDIVILDIGDLITREGIFELPSKGYGFNKFHVIIEIKLRRINNKNDKKFNERIEHDRTKIERVRRDVENKSFFSYLIIFDKNRINFVNNSNGNHTEFYVSSKDWFYEEPIMEL